jgi:taurine--2-oxoglutarate transaminase
MKSVNTVIPDTNEEVLQLCADYSFFTWYPQKAVHPIPIKSAQGCWMEDFNGKKYFDLGNQLVCVNAGYGQQKIADAIAEQVGQLPYVRNQDVTAIRAAASKKMIEFAPPGFAKVLFSLAGADANEYAIKMAKQLTKKSKIFSQYGAYHGSTYGANNLCGDALRGSAIPQIPGFIHFFGINNKKLRRRYPDQEELCEVLLGMLEDQILYEGPEHIAGIFHESISGSVAGVVVPPAGYYKGVRALCDKYEIIMVQDEVMAGFGRSGKRFTFEHFDFQPDLVTFAKGVTSSYFPVGGVLISSRISDKFDEIPLNGGLTYNAHSVGCAAVIATLEVYEEQKLVENSAAMGKRLKDGLLDLQKKHPSIGEVRGEGLFLAVELADALCTPEIALQYEKAAIDKGYLSLCRAGNLLFTPSLVITAEEVDMILKDFDEVYAEFDKLL